MTPPSSPKGSLEELFRHHLLDGEAAAVPPLPHVWEQLDNTLLLAQNAQYRRRLRVYRWAVAASLLVAVMASGGWWRSQLGQNSQRITLATSAGAPTRASGRSPAADERSVGLAATNTAILSPNAFAIDDNTTLFLSSATTGQSNAPGLTAGNHFA
ncbi:MAG: hypothetical protein EOO63_02270, partial [Hymenobacter sp.]